MASSHYYAGRIIKVNTFISNFPLPNYTTFRTYSYDSTKRFIYESEKAHINSGTTEWAIVAHYLNDSIFKMDYTIYDTTYRSQSS